MFFPIAEFACDFVGFAATEHKQTSFVRDTPTSALIGVAMIGSALKSTRDFVVDALGLPGAPDSSEKRSIAGVPDSLI